jgi:hypothetical protein
LREFCFCDALQDGGRIQRSQQAREQGFLMEVSGLAIMAEESSMNNARRGKV